MAGKPKFDPNQPFVVAQNDAPAAKPQFDPNAPFEPIEEPSAPEKPGLIAKGLDLAGRGLDYLGGIGRASVATAADLQQMRHDPKHEFAYTAEDWKNVAQGKGPTTGEYLKRQGVPEGPSVKVPFTDDMRVSARDVGGFIGDVASDPITVVAQGAKALKPVSTAAEAGGRALYKSGLKKVDEKLVEKGAKDISDVLLEEGGKVGTTKTLAKEAEAIGKKAAAERKVLYQKAADKGVTIDMGFPMANAEKQIEKMASDPGMRPMAEKLGELLQSYKNSGKVGIDALSEWKTNLYNSLPEVAYDVNGKVKGPANDFRKALASDFKNAIVEAGNTAEKGLGDKIDKLNETMQSVIESRKPLKMQVRRANTPNLISAVDAMIAGGGAAATSPAMAASILAAKKAAQAASTTAGRTAIGKGLMTAGKSGAPDILLRQGLITAAQKKRKGLVPAREDVIVPVTEGYEQ
jgi:hypothetical protein